MKNKHHFLFIQSNWTGEGHYMDQNDNSYEATIETTIIHSDKWHVDSTLKVAEKKVSLQNFCIVNPCDLNASNWTLWKSKDFFGGELNGSFMIHDNTIVSTYESTDRKTTGFEYLVRQNDKNYIQHGVVFVSSVKYSSWEIYLKRK